MIITVTFQTNPPARGKQCTISNDGNNLHYMTRYDWSIMKRKCQIHTDIVVPATREKEEKVKTCSLKEICISRMVHLQQGTRTTTEVTGVKLSKVEKVPEFL